MTPILLLSFSLMSSCGGGVSRTEGGRERVFVLDIGQEPATLEIFEVIDRAASTHSLSHRSYKGAANSLLTTGAQLLVGPGQRSLEARFIEPEEQVFEAFVNALELGAKADDLSKPWNEEVLPALFVRGGSGVIDAEVARPCAFDDELKLRLETLLFSEVDALGRAYRVPIPDDKTHNRIIVKGGKALIEGRRTQSLRNVKGEVMVRALKHPAFSEGVVEGISSTVDAKIFRVSRLEFDVNQSSPRPGPLAMVFVVDRSVSHTAEALQRDRQLIEKTLDAAPPGSAYSVVTFAHDVRVMVPPFTPRPHRETLRAGFKKIARANGSLLGAALKKAQGILADVGARAGRLLVLTDAELPLVEDVFAGEKALSNVITHVVDTESSGPFVREKNRKAVADTGGVWVSSGDEGLTSLASYLIRPTQLDDVKVLLAGVRPVTQLAKQTKSFASGEEGLSITSVPAVLPEHTSYSFFVEDEEPALDDAPDEVLGMLWMKPVRFHLHRSSGFLRGLGGVMASGDYANAIAPEVRRDFAEQAGVLNEDRALEFVPAYRAPPEHNIGMAGVSGACGCGGSSSVSLGHSSRCGIGAQRSPYRRSTNELLSQRLVHMRKACGEVHGALDIEFGEMELIWVSAKLSDENPRAQRCVAKAYYDWLLLSELEVDGDFAQFRRRGRARVEF